MRCGSQWAIEPHDRDADTHGRDARVPGDDRTDGAWKGQARMAGRRQRLVETARKNRVELVDAGLTRRDLIQLGLLTAGGYLVAKLGLSTRAAGAGGAPKSPQTTPWVEELPIPPVAIPVEPGSIGTAPRQ